MRTVQVIVPGLLDSLNPLLSRSAAARAVAALVLPGLVAAGSGGRFMPDLAERWDTTNGRDWIFHLNPARHWQDGVPVTAADVAYTVGLLHAAGSPVDPALSNAWRDIHVMTPDSETVVLTGPPPLGAGLLDLATLPILPAHLLASTAPNRLALLPFSSHPVGSGDYRVVDANSFSATLVATSGDGLAPRQLVIHAATGAAAHPPASPAADSGAVSVVANGPPPASSQVVPVPLARPVFLFLNTRQGALADPAVRRALNLAINRQKLVTAPLQNQAVPLFGPVVPGLGTSALLAQLPGYDAGLAASTLQQAGWLRGSTGARSRQGALLSITLLVDSDPARLATAGQIARMWQAVGVTVTIEAVGLDGLIRDFALPGRFDAMMLGIRQRGVLPDLSDLWHTGGALNISGVSDPLMDAALDATGSTDAPTRQIGYARFAQRFVDEIPAIPLYLPTARYAVQGLRLPAAPLNDPADVLRGAANWRLVH